MRECSCPVPNSEADHPDPARRQRCITCGFHISAEWSTTDANVAAFFDRLAESVPEQASALSSFRAHCERREKVGRSHFRHAYLGRDNAIEATEEAADGALYAMLDVLKARRAGDDDDIDLALQTAYFFWRAHQSALHLRARRLGAP